MRLPEEKKQSFACGPTKFEPGLIKCELYCQRTVDFVEVHAHQW